MFFPNHPAGCPVVRLVVRLEDARIDVLKLLNKCVYYKKTEHIFCPVECSINFSNLIFGNNSNKKCAHLEQK